MRKFTTTVLAMTAVFVVAGFTHKSSASNEDVSYTLRVTSDDPDQELRFRGTVAFGGGGAPLYITGQSTPFELDVGGEFVVGIFSTVEGPTRLTVDLLRIDGETSRKVASGSGAHILMENGLYSPESRTVRGLYCSSCGGSSQGRN